ncbi:MAG: xanthine dehydrogenase accessory protein XdhC [Rhodopila sp.]
MAAWIDALLAAERDNQSAVLVTVLAVKGSTPREAGAKMVVSVDGIFGTIGGGNLEHQCEATARALLAGDTEGPSQRNFPLGPELGQCCGGHVTVLFEVLRPPRLHVALFGAGHVGKALVKLLADLPCRARWIDSRPDVLPANLPPAIIPLRIAEPARVVENLPADSMIVVMTHDHQLDFDIVAAALRRPDFRAVALIGSETKRARFAGRLARANLPRAAIDRLICPIGLPGIEGKEPAVVALSVAAQIMQFASATARRNSAPAPAIEPAARTCGDCVCPPVVTAKR